GSRSSIKSIEPFMSANNAVTVLRSPSRLSGAGASAIRIWGPGFLGAGAGDAPRTAPHSPQNLSPASFDAPQLAHLAASGDPHCAQNLRPSRLSAPHFEQRMFPFA